MDGVIREEKMAVSKFIKLRSKKGGIICPALGFNIIFTDNNFKHLTYKDKNHKRSTQEIKMRSICFLSVDKIIKKSGTYQEYLCEENPIIIKKHGKKEKIMRKIEYIGLVAIVDGPNGKHRIRVVIKKNRRIFLLRISFYYASMEDEMTSKFYVMKIGNLKKAGFQIKRPRAWGRTPSDFFNYSISKKK